MINYSLKSLPDGLRMKLRLPLFVIFFIATFSFAHHSDINKYSHLINNPGEGKKNFDLARTMVMHKEYDVLAYDISLTVFPDSDKIEAVTGIKLSALISIENNLLFDFSGLQVDSVLMDMELVQSFLQDELLSVQLPQTVIAGDTHFVQIYYQGTPLKGLYFRQNSEGNSVIYTHNEPYDAHFWFPCKDDPSDKATLDMKITIPGQFTLISNGSLVAQSNAGPLFTLHHWKEDYPIATYLISFAAGPYTIVTDSYISDEVIMPLDYYVYPSDLERGREALGMAKEMLDFYSSYIGEYPFLLDKYAMVEVPLREAAAMENQTATTMGDFVMDDENIIAHELAHQWWGDALTPDSFVDIWLNEGFATYFDALFTEYKYGYDAFLIRMDQFRGQMNSDGSLPFPIYDPPPEHLFGRAVYLKGAWVLHMLRMEVGDSLFKEICQHYSDNYKYLNVNTLNFKRSAEIISNKNLSLFFDQWLNYGGMPIIIGEWQQNNNVIDLSLRQDQTEPVYKFDLEVLVKGVSKDTLLEIPLADKLTYYQIFFTEPVIQVLIDPNKKILNTNNSPLYYIPNLTSLVRLYPNPFNQEISISYQLGRTQSIKIDIYNILGEKVESLVDERKTIGLHSTVWSGKSFASGIYFCILEFENGRDIEKMMLIK